MHARLACFLGHLHPSTGHLRRLASTDQKALVTMSLPLVRIPASTSVHRLGTSSLAPTSAVLRFGQTGWTIPRSSAKDGRQGWAIVGDAEGRRLMVEVRLAV